jgi:rhodanese-related sulfurtransferase
MTRAMAIRTISPQEAQQLIASGQVEVVDVREAAEWVTGHLPGARHVPLDALARDPKKALPRDDVVFVCAHGMRSLTAASIAQSVGKQRVYSVDGGTVAWAGAGLPLARD